jgi:hypothetical protein
MDDFTKKVVIVFIAIVLLMLIYEYVIPELYWLRPSRGGL